MNFQLPQEGYKWQQMSRVVAGCWLAFYLLFLVHAYNAHWGALWIDNANMVTHESGHMLFGFGGERLAIWGGTLMQLLVPAALAISFAWRGQTAGAFFCAFFFFENFLGIALYMWDARDKVLPLVSVGASGDEITHDWNWIFTDMGVMAHYSQIAGVVRFVGWTGMIATVCVLVWFGFVRKREEAEAI